MMDKINATFKPAAAGPLEIRFYALEPTKREGFLTFYRSKLVPWLDRKGIDTANLSVIESSSSLQLVFAADPASPPWDTIRELDGLKEFLLPTESVVV
jgi:hypothetical protein